VEGTNSLRVRQDFRRELEEFACKERRKLGDIGEVLLEWAWAQLQVVESIDQLLKFKIRSTEEKKQTGGNSTAGAHL
jgi:hypothetical protein